MVEDTHHPCLAVHINMPYISSIRFMCDYSSSTFNYHKCDLEGFYFSLNSMDCSGVLETRSTEFACDVFSAEYLISQLNVRLCVFAL